MQKPVQVLIVEDEVNIRKGLREIISKDGHLVREASSGEEALTLLETQDCEVAIVDIRMPGMSGVDLLKEIKGRWPFCAVIMLTGHGTLESAMAALKTGAHDYLLKPVLPGDIRQALLKAHSESLRRREENALSSALRSGIGRLDALGTDPLPHPDPTGKQDRDLIKVGDLQIDLRAHEVCHNGFPIHLSPTEYNLLVILAQNAGKVLNYLTLVELGLGYQAEPWEAKELIKRHIFAIRRKIEPDPAAPIFLHNVRGIGYRLNEEPRR